MTLAKPIVRRGSLEIVDACNGFYLWGQDNRYHDVCVACLGDGADTDLVAGPLAELDDYPEAYDFIVVPDQAADAIWAANFQLPQFDALNKLRGMTIRRLDAAIAIPLMRGIGPR
jgi:hypothetical protein